MKVNQIAKIKTRRNKVNEEEGKGKSERIC